MEPPRIRLEPEGLIRLLFLRCSVCLLDFVILLFGHSTKNAAVHYVIL